MGMIRVLLLLLSVYLPWAGASFVSLASSRVSHAGVQTAPCLRRALAMTAVTPDAAERAAAAMAEMEAMEEKDQMGAMSVPSIASGPATYPLAAVVGQEAIKTALLLCAVNPSIGGVVISGSRGTAKSVMARAIHKIMPPIEVVKGSQFNIDKDSKEYDSFLEAELRSGQKKLQDLETEIIPTPFVQIPLDVLEDRLLGAVDVEKSVRTGETVFEPGSPLPSIWSRDALHLSHHP